MSEKGVEKNKTHFVFNKIFPKILPFFFSENLEKKFVEGDRPHMAIWLMSIACWVPKTTNTHLECVIRSTFPWQQWLHKRVAM
jgi:hypothetical protein